MWPPRASEDARAPVTVRFTVRNTGPSGPDWPEIVFADVNLVIGDRGGQSVPKGPAELESGKSFTYEHRCSLQDLPALKVRAEGTVSARRFFRIRRLAAIPTSFTKPAALAYARGFNDLGIHGPLESLRKAVFIPGPKTTFADVQALIAALTRTLTEIEALQGRLRALPAAALGQQDRAHLEAAAAYLTKTQGACRRFRDALSTADSGEIVAAAGSIEDLSPEAAQVDRATEELMRGYEISDEEASYRYRGR
ncbi:MAG: hypothetical protein EXR60_03990 [Dehalococcoidia bacterium]|nr:hypothetical protein [Dehalococcoidia bacterium]